MFFKGEAGFINQNKKAKEEVVFRIGMIWCQIQDYRSEWWQILSGIAAQLSKLGINVTASSTGFIKAYTAAQHSFSKNRPLAFHSHYWKLFWASYCPQASSSYINFLLLPYQITTNSSCWFSRAGASHWLNQMKPEDKGPQEKQSVHVSSSPSMFLWQLFPF